MVQFNYDPALAFMNNDFLTPVFFKTDALVRYFYTPDYDCEFVSETYATIRFRDGSPISIGISPENLMFAWLGDLRQIPVEEQQYLQLENVLSQTGDITSDFKDAQIEARFTDPIREVRILFQKAKLNELLQSKLNLSCFRTTREDVSEVIRSCARYKRVMYGHEDDVKRFTSELNEKIVEDIDASSTRTWLQENSIQCAGNLGGLKVFEILVKAKMIEEGNPVGPLFILYDFRIWADHHGAETNFYSVCDRLGIAKESTPAQAYDRLSKELEDAFDSFVKAANAL